jgi:NAD(P)-dependent dehydrogenase (short-subunit alcohol dehydrogenase family)
VNVSSGAGSHGDDQFGLTRRDGAAASYGISKAALNALTSTLAAELAGTRVLVNAVCPGLTPPGQVPRLWAPARWPTAPPPSSGRPPWPTTAQPASCAATDNACPGSPSALLGRPGVG